jgi:hypothetical protein
MNSICSFSKLKNFNILLVDNINTISAISGTYTLNQSDYAIGGKNVYFISNSTTPSSTGGAATNPTGTFTINVVSATKTIFYMVFAGGGGGGCGSNWRGRRGCFIHIIIIKYTPGSGGYGQPGGNSTLTINGTTYTVKGGGPGGPSGNNNAATGFSLGGGAGSNTTTVLKTGATGSKFSSGNALASSTNLVTGSGVGSSPYEAGQNGASAGTESQGGRGGKGMVSTNLSAPFNNFSVGTKYFCEGGSGAWGTKTSNNHANSIASYYGIGGQGGGRGTSARPTGGHTNTGSGGGGQLFGNGVNGGSNAGTGSNGGILLVL